MVSGPNGTAGIWATYPQDFASVATCIGDQVFIIFTISFGFD